MKVWSPPNLWTVGKVVNPELIVKPATSIDMGWEFLVILAPVKIPTENLPIGSVEYPTVVGIVPVSVVDNILHVIIPMTGLGDSPVALNCLIMYMLSKHVVPIPTTSESLAFIDVTLSPTSVS